MAGRKVCVHCGKASKVDDLYCGQCAGWYLKADETLGTPAFHEVVKQDVVQF